jgi:hypothetical protein
MLNAMELHNEDLHDENEDRAGEKVNLATGKPIDNSTYTGMENMSVVEPNNTSEDIMGALPDEDDEAAKWLREAEKKRGGDDLKEAA